MSATRVRALSLLAVMASTCVALAVGIPAAGAASPAPGGPPVPTAGTAPSALVTRLLVSYVSGVNPDDGHGNAAGGDHVSANRPRLRPGRSLGGGMRSIELSAPVDAATARAMAVELETSPLVRSAEPDAVMTALTTESPTPSWGLDRIDQRSLPGSTSYSYDTSGSGVTAYIVDTGIRATHVDLAGRVRAGDDEVKDGNGTNDCNGHGTHVSGTVGGTSYGVAKSVTLVPVRVLGCTGSGTASGLIAGLNWVIADHAAGVPAVLNMSLGFGAVVASVDTVVKAVIADGVTVVVASGNSNVSSCTSTPGDVPEAITVNASGIYGAIGAAAASDTRASFSNYGACSDIYAPGVQITSSWSTSDTATNTIEGTSMASPHVAGAAARVLQTNPTYTPAQVWTALSALATTIPASGLASDPAKLLFLEPVTGGVTPPVVATTPSAPGSVTAASGNNVSVVRWTAPTSNGGAAITSFTARAWTTATGGTTPASKCTGSGATATTCTLASLGNGTTYYVDVIATNSVGAGAASSPRAAVVPLTVPTAPRTIKVTAGVKTAVVSWLAPVSNGGSAITGYTARAWTAVSSGSQVSACTSAGATLTCTITALTTGATYYVDVIATSKAGSSPASAGRVSVLVK